MNSSKIRLPHQSTTNIVQSIQSDIIHNISYDYHGQMLATISGDQIIKIFKLINKQWTEIQEIKYNEQSDGHTHKSKIINICWAHPLFGSIFITYCIDKSINIFELGLTETNTNNNEQLFQFIRKTYIQQFMNIICCEFSPYYLGLKLSIVCNDGIIKIMEPKNTNTISDWKLSQQIIINANIQKPFNINNNINNNIHNIFDTQLNKNTKIFCISWNNNKYEFPSFCVGANNNKIFIFGYISKHWKQIEKINIISNNNNNKQFDIHSINWSNHIAKKYHLIACGCNDGYVRIIKIQQKFESKLIFETNISKQSICKIKWNISGTSLIVIPKFGNIYLIKKDIIKNTYVKICLNINIQKRMEINDDKKEIEEEKEEYNPIMVDMNKKNNDNVFGGFGANNFNFGGNNQIKNEKNNDNNNNFNFGGNINDNNNGADGFNFGAFGNSNNENNDKNNNAFGFGTGFNNNNSSDFASWGSNDNNNNNNNNSNHNSNQWGWNNN